MGTAKSRYIGPQGQDTITNNDYTIFVNNLSPLILTINILRQSIEFGHIYDITLIANNDPNIKAKLQITQTFNQIGATTSHINTNPGILIDYNQGNPQFVITIDDGSVFTLKGINKYSVSKDTYTFIYSGQLPSYISFYRNPTLNVITPRDRIFKISNDPIIMINSQTLIDGSDVGYTKFEVINQKISIYEKSYPKIVSVLRGKGLTAAEKVDSIFSSNNFNITFYQFGVNILFYSMLRYFLSKLLYGNFDVNYLLKKYYNKFIEDLSKSEYNKFLRYFTDPTSMYYGYEKIFLTNNI